MLPSVTWVIGDGRNIRFWADSWLENKPLLEDATSIGVSEVRARDQWNNGFGWDFSQIMIHVSEQIRLKLLSVVLDDVTGAQDRISWGHNSDGRFTVSSAYNLLSVNSDLRPDMGKLFERVWKVVAPERVRVFLWLGLNQVLMTNMERHRRHMSTTGYVRYVLEAMKLFSMF